MIKIQKNILKKKKRTEKQFKRQQSTDTFPHLISSAAVRVPSYL